MIGALMYLTSSRPDIVHATCLCARYQAKPTEKHLKEVKRIFRYLRGTVNTGLWYTKDSGFELTGFSDADYAGCKDTFKSTSSGAQFLAIVISCNPVQHSRTKHIAVRYHFIKEHVEKGTIELYFVKTDYQLADIFTKALLTDRFNYLVRRLGSVDGVTTSLQLSRNSRPPMLDHQDKYMMKAQKRRVMVDDAMRKRLDEDEKELVEMGEVGEGPFGEGEGGERGREETDEITDLHQILEELLLTTRGDGVVGIRRRRRDPSSDGVRDLVMVSGLGRLNEDLESST
nr:hypothetical protein [Tanacetum cinerariifolium]